MPVRYSKYFQPTHLIVDLFFLNLCFWVTHLALIGTPIDIFFQPHLELFVFINLAWSILVLLFKPYRISRISRFTKIINSHISIIIVHLLLLMTFLVLRVENINEYSRNHIILSYLTFAIILLFWKFSFTFLLKVLRKKGYNFRKIIIVGYGELSEDLSHFFNQHPEYGFQLLGFFDNKVDGKHIKGRLEDIHHFVLHNKVDQIYCCLPYLKYTKVKDIINFADDNGVKVKLITDFRGFSFKGLELERYDNIPVINVTAIPLDLAKNKIVKRVFDITFSLVVFTMILSWLIPLIALLIRIDSKGPIFFKQIRTGKDNKDFECWKFRTMYVNGDADTKQATKNDPRITRIGAILRKTSLDELPQFLNVLKGDMSVVGPRPHPLFLNEKFSPVIEKFKTRHFVKPGITGLAQAKGFRGETSTIYAMKNRVKFDRFYIENWSLILDLKILILTVLSLIRGDENAF